MKSVTRLPVIVVALVGLIVAASAQQPAGGGTFQTAVEYAAGSYPWAAAVGEFNGDATPDLVVANLGLGVSVLLGVGDGSLRAPAHYRTGSYAATVAVGDFDGDGKDDLVVGSEYDDTVVLMNRGDGTFGSPMLRPGLGAGAVGDFNGDGRADVAVGGVTFGGIGVFLGNGDGTFQPALSNLVGPPYPRAIVVADFNGDTYADLATNGNYGLHLIPGNGDGTFGAAQRVSDTDAIGVVTGDFNGDGKADLAAFGYSAGGVLIHQVLGHGDGRFRAPVTHRRDLSVVSLAAGDLNADGRDDLAAVGYLVRGKSGLLSSGDVAVMLAAEGGSFGPEVHYGAGDSPRALTVADINSDGRPDLAVTNPTSFGVSVLLNGPVAITRTMHVGNIDSHAKPGPDGSTWQLLVQIRTDNEAHAAAPAGTLVSGSWEDRTLASCATEILGSCVIGRFGIAAASGSATFRVTGLSNPAYPEHGYGPADNHDPTGDSDGTSITVYRP